MKSSKKSKSQTGGSRLSAPAAETSDWSPAATRERIGRFETVVVLLLLLLATGLRFSASNRIAIEHWDEAVYASNRFADGGYPFRFLYAPPLLPAIIEWTMLLLGPNSFAAVVPNLLFGTLTAALCWWVAREWFGPAAGIAAAALATFSEFHILYSRTALTDPALSFWFLLAVYCVWRALATKRMGEAIAAGLAVGLAWYTKYNGWLPLAVGAAGFIAWVIFERTERRQWTARIPVLIAIPVVAAFCFAPVLYDLQSQGGYSAVSANHAKYFVGLPGWAASFTRQASNLRFFDGTVSAAGVGVAWLSLAMFGAWIVPVVGAVLFGLLSFIVGATAVLALLGLVGPVAVLVGSLASRQTDETAKYRRLAAWLLLAWILGLLVSTPAYTPYPRLLLPWLVAIWLGAAALIGLLARRKAIIGTADEAPAIRNWRWFLVPAAVWVCGVILWAFAGKGARSAFREAAWQDRAGRAGMVLQAAAFANQAVGGAPAKSPVFYTYGEPAIFFHLATHGFAADVVGSFDFLAREKPQSANPTYVLAYQTPEFQKLIAPYLDRLGSHPVSIFHDTPSDVVLLDSYPPSSIASLATRPHEELRLYRVQ